MIWMVPIIFFSTVITKEGVKSSPCGSVVCFEETKMPLEKKINENKPYPLCSLYCILRRMQSQGRRKHITGVYFYHFFYPLPKIYDVAFPKVSSTVVDGSLHSLFSHQVVLATNEVKLGRASVKLLSRIFKLLWSNYYLSNSMCSISKFF